MEYRPLGKHCGCDVSEIGIGTVSLGVPYGIPATGDFGVPDDRAAIRLLQLAADHGITLFDTAPAYGRSEALLGDAIGGRHPCRFATKMAIPRDKNGRPLTGQPLVDRVERSLSESRRNLRRDAIDILQIHNLTTDLFQYDDMIQALHRQRELGNIGCLGATVYTAEEAMAVVRDGRFQMIQVAYNLLDRTMETDVMPVAQKSGVGSVVRSVYLKGVLTEKAVSLPPDMKPLKQMAGNIANELDAGWKGLSEVSLRFSMFNRYVACALVGIRRESELIAALDARANGPLPVSQRQHLDSCIGKVDAFWINPMNWPMDT